MKNAKHIIIIPNYDQRLEIIKEKYLNLFSSDINIEFYDWSQFYNQENEITFQTYYKSIFNFLKNKSNQNSIIIATGISSAIINSMEFEYNKKILVSPIFAKSYVNPYTTDLPSYKPNLKCFSLKLNKEYYNLKLNKKNWNSYFKNEYDFYILNYSSLDTILAQFSEYNSLKIVYKNETKYLKNTYCLSGIFDKQSKLKYVYKFAKKHNLPLFIFNHSSQHLIDEENSHFKKIINEII